MTAINFSLTSHQSRKNIYFQVEVYDFDNEVYLYEVYAHSEDEAGSKAADIAQSHGIDVSYTCAYAI